MQSLFDPDLAEATKKLPPGLEFKIIYDTSDFVVSAIDEVYRTIFEDETQRIWLGGDGALSVFDHDRLVGRHRRRRVVALGAPRRVPVPRVVDGDERARERQGHGVPRVCVLGAAVEEVTPAFADTREIIRCMWNVHEAGNFGEYLAEFRDRMDPGLVAAIEDGQRYSGAEYVAMRGRKLAFWDSVRPLFEKYDLLLSPTVSVAAFDVGRLNPKDWPDHPWDWFDWASFSYPFNFTGQPALSLPMGFDADGLPLSVQLVARPDDEATILALAAQLEGMRGSPLGVALP